MVVYFAYGSNMDESHLRSRVPTAKILGIARLDGYRLAFTRRSIKSNAGVADIIVEPGFAVFGAAFEIDELDIERLDRAEGVHLNAQAYRRHAVQIRVNGKMALHDAVTYSVVTPSAREIVPRPEYLEGMTNALMELRSVAVAEASARAIEIGRIEHYVKFLKWLRRTCIADDPERPGTDFVRPGLLVAGTGGNRKVRASGPVVQLNPDVAPRHSRYVAVHFDSFDGIGCLVRDPSLDVHIMAVDQLLRHALGIVGQLVFGHTCSFSSVQGAVTRVLQARTVTLRLSQAKVGDSEKRLCIMHPRNLELLGISSGEFVKVVRPVATPPTVVMRQVTIRCFPAVESVSETYPRLNAIYLDDECRAALGITNTPNKYLGMPILVSPSITRAVQARVVLYGITVLLGLSSFTDLISRFLSGVGNVAVAVIALAIAVALTVGLAVFDLRSKLQP